MIRGPGTEASGDIASDRKLDAEGQEDSGFDSWDGAEVLKAFERVLLILEAALGAILRPHNRA